MNGNGSYQANGANSAILTVGEAAELLHVHPNTLRRWEAMGMVQARRVGPRQDRRFLREDIVRLLEVHTAFQDGREASTRSQPMAVRNQVFITRPVFVRTP